MNYRQLQQALKAARQNGLIGPLNLRAKKSVLEAIYAGLLIKVMEGKEMIIKGSTALYSIQYRGLAGAVVVFKSGDRAYHYCFDFAGVVTILTGESVGKAFWAVKRGSGVRDGVAIS